MDTLNYRLISLCQRHLNMYVQTCMCKRDYWDVEVRGSIRHRHVCANVQDASSIFEFAEELDGPSSAVIRAGLAQDEF